MSNLEMNRKHEEDLQRLKNFRLLFLQKLLLLGKLDYEEIAKVSNLTVDEVKALDEKRSA